MKTTPVFALLATIFASALAQAAQPLPPLKPYKGPPLNLSGAIDHGNGFESDTFTIACWVPSMYDLDKWAKRGITVTWFNQRINPKDKPLSEYVAKANALGLKMWRYPAQYMDPALDPSFDAKDPTLIAYSLIDEPLLHHKTPADIKEQADQFKAANPKMKVVLNLEGDKFVMPNPSQKVIDENTGFMNACDIGFVDWYVKNRNAGRYPLSHLWTAVERLTVWSKGKPVGAFIECSNQKISPEGREPTPDEMRGEIIGSIIHGARLIAYFPESPGNKPNKGKQFGTGNDGTPPELEKELVTINHQLQSLAPILNAKGARLTTLPAPIIGAIRVYKGSLYLIVMNNDDEQKTTFNNEPLGPYEWRVYTAGPAPKK
jgi:hypothetical protein